MVLLPVFGQIEMSGKSDFERLVYFLCVQYGFCGGIHDDKFVHVSDLVPPRGTVTADDFIDWMFFAEGMLWLGDAKAMFMREKMRSAFIACMGSYEVDARRLRYRLRKRSAL